MDLDRQTIEKKDFPIGRRGYEPEAVDEHLAVLAAEVESLRRAQRARPGESLASAAAAQVQSIVEAAETTASDIQRQADLEARRLQQEAERSAERTRDDAVERAERHVEGVSKATALMLQRVDAMESEVNALLESLRTGAQRLTADLTLLEGNMGELYDAAGRKGGAGAARRREAPAFEDDDGDEDEAGDRRDAAPAAAAPPSTPEPDAQDAPADLDGARLIALNMAVEGRPREEADRYLAEHFDVPDRQTLLDEVYSRVQNG